MIRRATYLSKFGYFSIETENENLIGLSFGTKPFTFAHPEPSIVEAVMVAVNENFIDYNLWIRCKLIGSLFQLTVWDTLRTIPKGQTATYKSIAKAIGRPNAVRAVGTACGANPLAIIIPCHRVIKSNGELGKYAYGEKLKAQLLDRENATYRISS